MTGDGRGSSPGKIRSGAASGHRREWIPSVYRGGLSACVLAGGLVPRQVKAPLEESAGKVSVLLQSYIGGARPSSFTLASDTNYVAQNAGRVSRAIFEIALRKGWCALARTMLEISKSVDKRVW